MPGASQPPTSRRSRIVRRLLSLSLVVFGLLAVAAIRWQATLNWLGGYLVCSEPLEPADLIVVMGGNFWGPRTIKAAELAKQQLAPLVLISGPPYRDRPEGGFAIPWLVQKGYPRDSFAVFGHNEHSTFGEVLLLRRELERRGVKRIIVVTSDYHSRRCAILFRLLCPGLQVISVPAPDSIYSARGWWRIPGSRSLVFSEWTKIIGSVLIAYPVYRISHWR